MAISLKTTKLLWARSGSLCAICRELLIEDATDDGDDDSIVGDIAHIIARKPSFTRGDYDSLSEAERDHYSNLILLCRKHHKIIDDQPAYYTIERLHQIKSDHEMWVRSTLKPEDHTKECDDLAYAGIIDTFCKQIDIDHWTGRGTFIYAAEGPCIDKAYHKALSNIPPWIISRVWPHRYEDLEEAFYNFKEVLGDFVNVMNRYLDDPSRGDDRLRTRRFYQIDDWNREKYEELFRQYDEHICLVGNLFTEVTRAANLICDRVRKNVFHGFRIKEGILLVQRDMVMVGESSSTQFYRAEYTTEKRMQKRPYKGLEEFKRTQFKGEIWNQRRTFASRQRPPTK